MFIGWQFGAPFETHIKIKFPNITKYRLKILFDEQLKTVFQTNKMWFIIFCEILFDERLERNIPLEEFL